MLARGSEGGGGVCADRKAGVCSAYLSQAPGTQTALSMSAAAIAQPRADEVHGEEGGQGSLCVFVAPVANLGSPVARAQYS